MPESTRPLTQPMVEAIMNTVPGDLMKGGPTRAALMRRGLVHNRVGATAHLFGKLTAEGERLRENLLETKRRADRAKALKAEAPVEETVHSWDETKGGIAPCGLDVLVTAYAKWTPAQDEVTCGPCKLEVPTPPSPAQQAAAEGDRYMSTGPGADVKARDARLDTPSDSANRMASEVARALGGPLPQRVPAVALTEELTGERVPDVPAATQGVRYRPSVSLRPVTGEVVERATPETFVAVGAIWGRLEGHRVRIAAMDGDVFYRRSLMLVEAGAGEPSWSRIGDHTAHLPVALHEGTTVLVDGYQLYRVGISPLAGQGPKLWPVRS